VAVTGGPQSDPKSSIVSVGGEQGPAQAQAPSQDLVHIPFKLVRLALPLIDLQPRLRSLANLISSAPYDPEESLYLDVSTARALGREKLSFARNHTARAEQGQDGALFAHGVATSQRAIDSLVRKHDYVAGGKLIGNRLLEFDRAAALTHAFERMIIKYENLAYRLRDRVQESGATVVIARELDFDPTRPLNRSAYQRSRDRFYRAALAANSETVLLTCVVEEGLGQKVQLLQPISDLKALNLQNANNTWRHASAAFRTALTEVAATPFYELSVEKQKFVPDPAAPYRALSYLLVPLELSKPLSREHFRLHPREEDLARRIQGRWVKHVLGGALTWLISQVKSDAKAENPNVAKMPDNSSS